MNMPKQPKAPEMVTVNLPLPVDLHTALKSEAAKNRKTIRAYVVEALRSQLKRAS
jgi:predicted HicB family RNase H-like nuclease